MIGYILLLFLLKEEVTGQTRKSRPQVKWDNKIPFQPGYICDYETHFLPNLNFLFYTCVHISKCIGHYREEDLKWAKRDPKLAPDFDNCPYIFYPPAEGGNYVCCHPADNKETPSHLNTTIGKHYDPWSLTFVPGFRSAFKCNDYKNLACLDTKLCPDSRRRGYKGGTETDIQKYPHLATVFWYNFQYKIQRWACLASIISETFLLSSAGCIIPFDDDQSYFPMARVGDNQLCDDYMNCSLSKYSQVFMIIGRYTPPLQQYAYYYNDLLLLKLNTSIEWNPHVRPGCLGHALNTYEWNGMVAFYEEHTKDGMKKNITSEFEIQILNDVACGHKYASDPRLREPRNTDKEIMFCAGLPHADRTPCLQDYGAPIQYLRDDVYCTWMIYGVLAYSPDLKCKGEKPPMFTRVPYYIGLIEDHVWAGFNIFEQYNTVTTQCKDPLEYPLDKDHGRCRP